MTIVTPAAARAPARLRRASRARTRSTTSNRMLSNDVPEPGSRRRAAADAEGARDRAAARVAARRGRRPAAHRARARRGRARAADAHALRREVRDRARGAHLDDRLRRRSPTGSRTATTASPRSRCSTPTLERRSATRSSSGCASRPATPRFGREIDDRVLPAEAGLDERAISFTKGCYPGPGADRAAALPRQGQPPPARARGRRRRARAPRRRSPTARRTSAASRARVPGLALAYVRVEVPDDAELRVGSATRPATLTAPSRP